MSETSDSPNKLVNIAGTATFVQASALRDQLAAAVADSHAVVVAFEATEVDVSAIQLLIAARQSMEAKGGTLRLAGPPTGALIKVLTLGGFIHHGAQDALWATELN